MAWKAFLTRTPTTDIYFFSARLFQLFIYFSQQQSNQYNRWGVGFAGVWKCDEIAPQSGMNNVVSAQSEEREKK